MSADRIENQSLHRRSSMILPSFGNSPGERNATSARKVVTAQRYRNGLRAQRVAVAFDMERHPILAVRIVDDQATPCEPGLVLGDCGDLRRMDEQAPHLDRLI